MNPLDRDLNALRHSAAHLLAHAMQELHPSALLTIGPATQEGFFYDFLPTQNITLDDLPALETRMRELSQKNIPITHEQISKQEARTIYANNPFKLELIDGIPGDTVGLAKQGDFIDLCKGGHVSSTGVIKYFKLLGLSGSYWRADKNNQQLQRITGTAFFTQQELDAFEQQRINAALYDHRRIGKELDLFSFQDEGVGFPFFHPKGKKIITLLIDYMRTLLDAYDYQEISTPIMLSQSLWEQSGHYDHYRDNMYFCCMENKSYAVKPMNCPGAILVYRNRPHSYRELPLRLAEFGLVHRYELSGVLHGLFRVRAFTQDDGHIFCTPDQIEQEVHNTITCINTVMSRFGFTDMRIFLSTKPKNAMGDDSLWQKATNALHQALQSSGSDYRVQEGEGAFYGPKIEFHIRDSLGRSWQCGTIQVDFFMPMNFDLSYISSQGIKERPVMIHRAVYGSMERFLGILLEHFKGHLPIWLSPLQVAILTITDDQKLYAADVLKTIKSYNIRAIMDETTDPIAGKIKSAQQNHVPLMLIIGKKEVQNQTVSLRLADGTQELGLSLSSVIDRILAQ